MRAWLSSITAPTVESRAARQLFSSASLCARARAGSTPRVFRESLARFPGNVRLWHAKCFLHRRQARRQLNRDPAAITSLSVACRYASRPPSVPTINPAFQEPGRPGRVLLLLGASPFSLYFPTVLAIPRRRPAATRCKLFNYSLSLRGNNGGRAAASVRQNLSLRG